MRFRRIGCVLSVCASLAAVAAAQREPVLKQIDVPHPYYYREMYLPQLTSGPSSVAWAPDSKHVVYGMHGWLWRQALDSQVAQQITSGPGYAYQPDCSPDGKWIVFTKYYKDALELYGLEVSSGRVTQLTAGGNVNLDARFSPDGKRIVFVSTAFNRRFHIFTGDFENGAMRNVERLTGETRSDLPRYYYSPFDHEISPAWSPDGREIIFISNRGRLYGTGGIWRMRAERGAEPREIHFEETTWKARPDWSPDGKRVVFSSYSGRQWQQLWVTTAEAGGYPFPISYGEYDNTAARWSPDGARIAFISNRGGNTSLWIQNAVGGAQRELMTRERKYAQPMTRLKILIGTSYGDPPAPLAARVSVRTGDGPDDRSFAPDNTWIHADDSFDRRVSAYEHFYFHAKGVATVNVPLGEIVVDIKRGLESRAERVPVNTRKQSTVTVLLRPISAPNFTGAQSQWAGGDVHVHMNYGGAYRNSPANLVRQADAEGLHVVNNLIVNKEQRVPDESHFTGKLDAASTARVLLWHSQEFHTSAWGHTGLLGLTKNLLLPDYAWYPQTAAASLYPSNGVVSDLARAQGGLLGYVHPFDAPPPDPAKDARLANTLPVDVALGKVDYLEVVGFSDHRATAEVWYRLLNCGFRVPAAGGTDAMMNYASLRGPVGLNRVYVRVPAGPLKMQAWLDGLKRGRTFATNGPLLDFSLGGKMIGDELRLPAAAREVAFHAAVRSFVPVDRAEIVCHGRVVKSLDMRMQNGVHSGDARGKIPVESSGWCVLRAWSESSHRDVLDAYPYATTSPIYVSVGGAAARSAEDAAYFVKWIDRVREFAEAHKDWNTPAEREHVLKQLAAARAIFERQLK